MQPGQQSQTIIAQRVLIVGTSDGLFVYVGAPVLGNPPVASIVTPGTTQDPYGNNLRTNSNANAILTIGTLGAGQLVVDKNGFLTLDGGTVVNALPLMETFGAASSMSLQSGQAVGGQSRSFLTLWSFADSPVNQQINISDGTAPGTPATNALLEVQGTVGLKGHAAPATPPANNGICYASSVDGTDVPLHYKDVTGNDVRLTPEPWQSMSTRGFQNSWVNSGAPNVLGQYRLGASGMVDIVGSLTVPVAAPNTVIINLPNAYHPSSTQRLKLIVAGQAGGTAQLTEIFASVDSTGNVTGHNFPAGLTSMTVEFAAGSRYSLNA